MSNVKIIHASVDDGHEFEVISVIPPDAKYSLMWMSAMGVAARNYLPMANILAEHGIAVFLHEWRGIGSSNWRASRKCDWGYRQLLELDMQKTFDIVEQHAPNAERILGGHSLGGQLASCFAGWVPRSAAVGLWLVCTGSPYYRTFPFPNNYGVFASYVLLPGIATLNGHLPGKTLRFAGNEARSVLRDWARTALTGKYQVRTMAHDFDALMARNPVPVTGVIMAKVMNVFSKEKVNPLIGSAGVSAVPMAARVSNKVSLANDPTNFILMQAMGPNVSGVIGSAVVAGVLYTLCR